RMKVLQLTKLSSASPSSRLFSRASRIAKARILRVGGAGRLMIWFRNARHAAWEVSISGGNSTPCASLIFRAAESILAKSGVGFDAVFDFALMGGCPPVAGSSTDGPTAEARASGTGTGALLGAPSPDGRGIRCPTRSGGWELMRLHRQCRPAVTGG